MVHFICNKLCLILLFILIFITIPLVSSTTDNLTEINNFLEKNLGSDFMQTYVGEPIINPVVDPTWNSFDVEKAKKFLNRETLPSAKTIVVYPIRIGNEESSFRVIIFSDNFFYSELSVPVQKIIEKDEAINLAKEKGLEEPINIVLMTNDNLFGWSITSSKDSNAIKEGEINQVTINMRSGNVSSNVFNPVVYKDKPNMSIILIITFLIVLLVIIIALVYRRRQKNEN